jgi:hypothetical protein
MSKYINLAPKLTEVFNSTGELVDVKAMNSSGSRICEFGVEVRVYGSDIRLKDRGVKGEFRYFRRASLPRDAIGRRYRGPTPKGYYPDKKTVELIYIENEGRKDEFPEIPFP